MAWIAEITKGLFREDRSTAVRWASSGCGPETPPLHGQRTEEEPSSRMQDEGCPNKGTATTIPDATGYSEPEEAASSE
jgi:hypothetical protein